MNKQRLESEKLVYEFMDTLDKSGANKEFWMKKFSKMSDAQFLSYIKNPFPFFFQVGAFKEPSMDQIRAVLKLLKVPLVESIYMPYKYTNKDGKPLKSRPCLVLYINDKRMKQLLTKKNKTIIDISMRDMRTGQLTGASKQGRQSDHEFESLQISSLDATTKELSRARGDAMVDKEYMNNTIKTLGQVSLKDLPDDFSDSLGKSNLSVMFLGAQLMTNLVNSDYLLPYTIKNRSKRVERVD